MELTACTTADDFIEACRAIKANGIQPLVAPEDGINARGCMRFPHGGGSEGYHPLTQPARNLFFRRRRFQKEPGACIAMYGEELLNTDYATLRMRKACVTTVSSAVDSYGFYQSMSRKGNPYDNAIMEAVYRMQIRELVQDAHYDNPEQARQDILDILNSTTTQSGFIQPWLTKSQFKAQTF